MSWGDRGRRPVGGRRVRRAPHATGFALAAVALAVCPALAEVRLPPGFSAQVYVTGQGFESGRAVRGIPATSTLVFDQSGSLYLARTGRRYQPSEADDLTPVYRVPPGGARMHARHGGAVLLRAAPPESSDGRRARRSRAVRDDLRPGPTPGGRLPDAGRSGSALRRRHTAPGRPAAAPPAGGRRSGLDGPRLRRRPRVGGGAASGPGGAGAGPALRRRAAAPSPRRGRDRRPVDRRRRECRGALAARTRGDLAHAPRRHANTPPPWTHACRHCGERRRLPPGSRPSGGRAVRPDPGRPAHPLPLLHERGRAPRPRLRPRHAPDAARRHRRRPVRRDDQRRGAGKSTTSSRLPGPSTS